MILSVKQEDLTKFLKDDALNQQNMKLSLTHLVICDGIVVGYVSILTDAMKLKILEDSETKDKIRSKLNISESDACNQNRKVCDR